MRRTIGVSLCAAAALLLSAGVGQAASKKSCQASWKRGDALSKEGKLREAKSWMDKCAAPGCPAVIRQQCAVIATRLSLDIPSIVPSVPESKDLLLAVEVSMDGVVLAKKIDGHAIDVDPGLHEFVFKSEGGAVVTEQLVIQEGQRNRPVPISFPVTEPEPPVAAAPVASESPAAETPALTAPTSTAPTPTAPAADVPPAADVEAAAAVQPASEPRWRSWKPTLGTYALTGVGALGLTGYYLFAIWGLGDNRLLAKNCSPNCKPESLDHVRTYYFVSKVSLGVGVLALGGATYLYLKKLRSPENQVASTRPPRYALQVAPIASGGWAALTGSF